MKNKEYFLIVKGEKIPVSKETYLAYCKELNRELYLKRLDRKYNLMYFSDFDKTNDNYIDHIKDDSVDVEKIVEAKMRIEDLYNALSKLNDEERKIIYDLYFNAKSIRKVAQENNVSTKKIFNTKKEVLAKLKALLE